MDIFEMKEQAKVTREQAAERLRAIADMLASGDEIEFERGGVEFSIHVPDEVELKIEFEVEDDERELEIELTW